MTPRYVHVALNYMQAVDWQAVQQAIDLEAIDWMRYAPNCYVLWTESELATIAGRLLTVPGMQANYFFICKIDIHDGFGWLPQWVWNWLRQNRTEHGFYLPPPPLVPPIS